MPFLKLSISELLPDHTHTALLKELSINVAKILGKPEAYVMVAIDHCAMVMGGQTGPAAFVDVRSIGGLNHELNRALSKAITELLSTHVQIPAERVFLNFQVFDAAFWGWRGDTMV